MNSNPSESVIKNKFRLSIAFKLGGRLFLKLLGIFLALDIFLCVFSAASVLIKAEQDAAAVMHAARAGWPAEDARGWLDAMGAGISPLHTEPGGWMLPPAIGKILPGASAAEARYLYLPASPEGEPFFRKLDGLTYRVRFSIEGRRALLSLDLGPSVRQCRTLFFWLFILEALMLLRWLFTATRDIRRTLLPIAELARTTQSLNAAHAGSFTPEEMERLAGKLEGITASKLDTRIALDATQHELRNLAAAINSMLDRIHESYRA